MSELIIIAIGIFLLGIGVGIGYQTIYIIKNDWLKEEAYPPRVKWIEKLMNRKRK